MKSTNALELKFRHKNFKQIKQANVLFLDILPCYEVGFKTLFFFICYDDFTCKLLSKKIMILVLRSGLVPWHHYVTIIARQSDRERPLESYSQLLFSVQNRLTARRGQIKSMKACLMTSVYLFKTVITEKSVLSRESNLLEVQDAIG